MKYLLALLFTFNAYASPTVHLVHATGPNGLSRSRALQLYNEAAAEIKAATGITLKRARWESIRNPFQHYQSNFNSFLFVLHYWEDWFAKRGSKTDLRVVITSPWIVDGRYYLGGYSSGTCYRRGTAMATAEEKNSDGAIRWSHSRVALTHEIMHLLGAKHTSDCSMMNYGALYCANTSIAQSSVGQVSKCSGGW